MEALLTRWTNHLMASDTRYWAVLSTLAAICLFVGWVEKVPL